MAQKKVYDEEFKIQAVKLGREIGFSKVAKELEVNIDTLYGWNKRAKDARLDLGPGTQTPDTAMSLTEEVQKLRQQTKEQAKVIEVRKMTFSERTQAEEALALIQGGKSFASVAASPGQDVKNTTVMERSDSPDPVEHMAFSMDTDEVSGIVEANGVYYILQCANGYDEEATQARKKSWCRRRKIPPSRRSTRPLRKNTWLYSRKDFGRQSRLRTEQALRQAIFLSDIGK